MRLFTKFASAAAVGALALTGCSSDGGDGDGKDIEVKEDASFEEGTTMDNLNKAGKITIGTKFDQPLFGLMAPSNKPEGFDVEMGRLVAAELGLDEDQIEWKEAVSANREPFLQKGEVAAVSTDNVILTGLADQNEGEFEVLEAPFTEEPYGIGLKKDDQEFRDFINDTLEAAYDDGRWETAWEDTAGKVLSTPDKPEIDRY